MKFKKWLARKLYNYSLNLDKNLNEREIQEERLKSKLKVIQGDLYVDLGVLQRQGFSQDLEILEIETSMLQSLKPYITKQFINTFDPYKEIILDKDFRESINKGVKLSFKFYVDENRM